MHVDDENAPLTDEQRNALNHFADKLGVFAEVAREMREAKTQGDGLRAIKRCDSLAEALMRA